MRKIGKGVAHGGGDHAAPLFALLASAQLAHLGIVTEPAQLRPRRFRTLIAATDAKAAAKATDVASAKAAAKARAAAKAKDTTRALAIAEDVLRHNVTIRDLPRAYVRWCGENHKRAEQGLLKLIGNNPAGAGTLRAV